MTTLSLREIAHALGGEVAGGQALCPGPGHSPRDRSLSVKLSASAPDGIIVHSHANDPWQDCRDYVLERLGMTREPRSRREDWKSTTARRPDPPEASERDTALWLWRQRQPILGTVAEVYLRAARGYRGAIPASLGFLPARGKHPPSLLAAFAIATEPEPGVLAIDDADVRAVQVIRLRPDGRGKADADTQKITLGRGALGVPICLAPPNDLLGLAICEGLEDALSIHQATGLGAWAAGGATRLPALVAAVPAYIEHVTIVADRDPAGIAGANALADGLSERAIPNVVIYPETPK